VLKCMMLLQQHLLRGASALYFAFAVPNHETFAETLSHAFNRTIHHILQVLESALRSVSRDNTFPPKIKIMAHLSLIRVAVDAPKEPFIICERDVTCMSKRLHRECKSCKMEPR